MVAFFFGRWSHIACARLSDGRDVARDLEKWAVAGKEESLLSPQPHALFASVFMISAHY